MLSVAGVLGNRAKSTRAAAAVGTTVPRLYTMGVVRQIAVQVLMILLLIEVIFLTEKLTAILTAAIDHHVSAGNIIMLLVYTAPRIFDLALPLALMIGVYRVVLRCREDREFLVLAGMGIGLHQLIGLALLIGAGAMTLSLLVSGSIDPRTRFAYRAVLFDAQHEALRGGITPGQFYFFDAYTVFAGERTVAKPELRLFVHHDQGATQRVIVAARARLTEPGADGHMTLQLNDIVAQDFTFNASPDATAKSATDPAAPCEVCEPLFTTTPLASMRIGNLAQSLNLDQLVRFEPRGKTPEEWTSSELVGLRKAPAPRAQEHVSALGNRFTRALLCLIAPLIAGIALALTTRASQAFVLPAAAAAVMSLDLASARIVEWLGGAGPIGMVLALTAAAAAFGLILVRQAAVLQHAIIKPALARA